MARFARRPRASNATIRSFFKKHTFVGSRFAPSSLKLTLMGLGRRGGTLLRQEKLRRKLPTQLRVQRKTKPIIG